MNTQPISINISTGTTTVKVPFNEDFVTQAKRMGGRWNGEQRAWIFDERDQQRVRDLCFETYGQAVRSPAHTAGTAARRCAMAWCS